MSRLLLPMHPSQTLRNHSENTLHQLRNRHFSISKTVYFSHTKSYKLKMPKQVYVAATEGPQHHPIKHQQSHPKKQEKSTILPYPKLPAIPDKQTRTQKQMRMRIHNILTKGTLHIRRFTFASKQLKNDGNKIINPLKKEKLDGNNATMDPLKEMHGR